MNYSKQKDFELEVLLNLDGEIFPMENGYWTKFEIKLIPPNEHVPHGIRYSLTLHDNHNQRVIGYDNAHAVKAKRKRYGGTRILWDHKHEKKSVKMYEFENAGQLIEDFWNDVNRYLLGV